MAEEDPRIAELRAHRENARLAACRRGRQTTTIE